MEEYFRDKQADWHEPTEGVIGVIINPVTGEFPQSYHEYVKSMYYLKGTEPPYY